MTERDPARLQDALQAWMRRRAEDPDLTIIALSSPASGASSDTLLMQVLSLRGTVPPRWVVRIAPISRQIYLEASVTREWRLLKTLHETTDIPAPRVGWLEEDAAVVGAPFFVMEHVDGRVVPTGVYNTTGWLAEASPREREQIWRNALHTMARIPSVDPTSVSFLSPDTASDGLAANLDYWNRYLVWATPGEHPVLRRALDWMVANMPPGRRTELSWGDARIGNMIFQDARCAAVIDWETPSLCGAEADLGWWLLFDVWDSEVLGVKRLAGLGDRAETVALWSEHMGRPPHQMEYYDLFAVFRLAAILERIANGLHLRSSESSASQAWVMQHLERSMADVGA